MGDDGRKIGANGDARSEAPDSTPVAESKPDPKLLTPETLQMLKKAGYPKPEGVSWGAWMGPKKLNHRHELVAMYAASGKTNGEIARELGFTDSRMSIILQAPRMQAAVKHTRERYFGEGVEKRFLRMLPKAVDVVEKILDNPSERSAIRLRAASELMNRAIGKPKETVEIKSSSVREIFDILDAVRTGQKVLDFAPRPVEPKAPTKFAPIEAEYVATQGFSPADVKTDIDIWVKDNVPTGTGIGKKDKV